MQATDLLNINGTVTNDQGQEMVPPPVQNETQPPAPADNTPAPQDPPQTDPQEGQQVPEQPETTPPAQEVPQEGSQEGEQQPPENPEGEEEPISKEEDKKIQEEAKKEEEVAKEETKEEIKDKSQDYINTVIDNLFEESTKYKIEKERASKEAEYYKEAFDKSQRELNDLKYDSKRIAVPEHHRPLLKLLVEHEQDPQNSDTEYRLISMLYEYSSGITGKDYRPEIQSIYREKAQRASNLTNNISRNPAAYSARTEKKTYKPQGVVRSVGGKRF